MRKILVTGANGFVGTALCHALIEAGYSIQRVLRHANSVKSTDQDFVVGEVGPDTEWSAALQDVEIVIHLAARAHIMDDRAANPLAEYRRINVLGTQRLARAAGAAGVRRIVFLSSIKVNGEETSSRPFTEIDAPKPQDAYGISKWEAELALQESAAASGMEAVILRPPLIYGPGVKGNFLRLMRVIDRGLPLPLASVRNRRNLLYIGNLVDAVILCLEQDGAANQTYLLADDDGIATPDLIRAIAAALGKSARLLPFPPAMLELAGAAVGKTAAVSRLLGSLQVDSTKIRRELGWRPAYSLPEALHHTAEWYYRMFHGNRRN